MARDATEERVYRVPYMTLLEKVRNMTNAGVDMALKSENPDGNGVWFRFLHGITWRSYGEKVTVTLRPQADGTTYVKVYSECGMPTQLFDAGQNKKNVEIVFQYLEYGLTAAPAGSAPAPTPVQPAPAPTPVQPAPAPAPAEQTLGTVFCASCGQQNQMNSNFCCRCGAKLIKPGM